MSAQNITYSSPAAPVRPPPPPRSDLVSPEVLPDGRVTFRIYARKATEISVEGEWVRQGCGTGGSLIKDEEGNWSLTVGPLVPDFFALCSLQWTECARWTHRTRRPNRETGD